MAKRTMTDAELLAWGQVELESRKADLARDRTAEGLDAARAAARSRARQAGMTMSAATAAVSMATRHARYASTPSAPDEDSGRG